MRALGAPVDPLLKTILAKKCMSSSVRKVADCRKFPSANNCDLYMSGSEEHVFEAAVAHAVGSHGHTDTPELREQVRASLADETVTV